MNITKSIENGKVNMSVSGRLDTTTSPELENVLNECLDGAKELVLDFTDLEYISSAGLRVILKAQKTMNAQGSMVIRNVSEDIMDIFDITGFIDILTVE